MSIRIDDNKRKALKVIASIEGKTIRALISDMIDDYVRKNRKKIINRYEEAEIMEIMMLSDSAFSEWDNEEDDIYNDL